MDIALYLAIGLVAGVLSGLLGIGGGVVLVPAMVFILGMNQHQAQGTTLAMLSVPICLAAAWTYYKAGYVDIKVAAFICIAFFFGGFVGAKLATAMPTSVLKKIFGSALMLIAMRMIFFK